MSVTVLETGLWATLRPQSAVWIQPSTSFLFIWWLCQLVLNMPVLSQPQGAHTRASVPRQPQGAHTRASSFSSTQGKAGSPHGAEAAFPAKGTAQGTEASGMHHDEGPAPSLLQGRLRSRQAQGCGGEEVSQNQNTGGHGKCAQARNGHHTRRRIPSMKCLGAKALDWGIFSFSKWDLMWYPGDRAQV